MKEVNDEYMNSLDHMEEPPETFEPVELNEDEFLFESTFVPKTIEHREPQIETGLAEKYEVSTFEGQLDKSEFINGLSIAYPKDKPAKFMRFIETPMTDHYMKQDIFIANKIISSGMFYDENTKQWYLDSAYEKLLMKIKSDILTSIPTMAYEPNFDLKQRQMLANAIVAEAKGTYKNINPFENEQMKYLMGLPDGMTYDFTTNEVRESYKEDYLISRSQYKLIKTDMNERLETENWLEFLTGDSYKTLMEFIGYCFARTLEPAQAFLILTDDKTNPNITSGSNGKTYVINYIKKLFGENYGGIKLSQLADPSNKFASSGLYGKQLVYDPDASSDMLSDVSTIKALTGNDSITAEFKGKDSFTFQNYAKMMFAMNDLPRFKDDGGFQRRIVIVPFERWLGYYDEAETQPSQDLLDIKKFNQELIHSADERGKFLWKCIQMFRNRWFAGGKQNNKIDLYASKKSLEVKAIWNRSNDSLSAYIDMYFEYTGNNKDRVPHEVARSLYDIYADDEQIPVNKRVGFSALGLKDRFVKSLKMTTKGAHIKHGKARIQGTDKNRDCYFGIRVKEEHYATYGELHNEFLNKLK